MIKVQEDMLLTAGVNVSSAEKILDESYQKYSRSLMSVNYDRAVDTSKLLNIPFLNLHTPADNMVQTFLEELFRQKGPETLQEIIDILNNYVRIKNNLNTRNNIIEDKFIDYFHNDIKELNQIYNKYLERDIILLIGIITFYIGLLMIYSF